MKDLILKKIEELEEYNQNSRYFCRLLDENDKEDKRLKEIEFIQRTRRDYAIIQLKDILEEMENE